MSKEIRRLERQAERQRPAHIPKGVKRAVSPAASQAFRRQLKGKREAKPAGIANFFKDKGRALMAAIGQMVRRESRSLPPQVRDPEGPVEEAESWGTRHPENELSPEEAKSLLKSVEPSQDTPPKAVSVLPPVPAAARGKVPPKEIRALLKEVCESFCPTNAPLKVDEFVLPYGLTLHHDLEIRFAPIPGSTPVQVVLPDGVSLPPDIRRQVTALETWFDREVPQVAETLEKEWKEGAPSELSPLLSALQEYPEINIWINLAILFLLDPDEWELRGIQWEAERLSELILAELRSYYQSHDFAHRRPPEKVYVLQDTVECTVKTPQAPLGQALPFDTVHERDKGIRTPSLKLRQKDRRTQLEQPLREAEKKLNQLVEAKAEDLSRRYPEKEPAKALPAFATYTWQDLGLFILISGKDPSRMQD